MTARVIALAGGGGGIGTAIANRFIAGGDTVVCGDVDGDHDHGTAACRVLDVTSSTSCDRFIDDVSVRFGGIDVLVNCAGIVRRAPAYAMSDLDFDDVVDVNLSGAFRLSRAAQPTLATRRGCIVNLASTNGCLAVANTVSYCVSKAGLAHLTRILALEWAVANIRVNAVAPTMVNTAMTADLQEDHEFMVDKVASIPMGRVATADEVAGAVSWLSSTRAAMVTGEVLYVDGGATIR